MARRVIATALFLILALAMTPVCHELCDDEEPGACVHSLTAILGDVRIVTPPVAMPHPMSQRDEPPSSALPADISHIPLLG